jgi:hypothetical protein
MDHSNFTNWIHVPLPEEAGWNEYWKVEGSTSEQSQQKRDSSLDVPTSNNQTASPKKNPGPQASVGDYFQGLGEAWKWFEIGLKYFEDKQPHVMADNVSGLRRTKTAKGWCAGLYV